MSRELKFRVWDNALNIFSSAEKNDAREFFIYFGGNRMIRCCDGYSVKTVVWDDEVKDRYVIQQYTGLKDKNDVEIYEGDIVHYYENNHIDSIVTDKNLLCKYTLDNAWFSFVEKPEDVYDGYYWTEINDKCEVIGNIFENSELLKQ